MPQGIWRETYILSGCCSTLGDIYLRVVRGVVYQQTCRESRQMASGMLGLRVCHADALQIMSD